jgi:hypothetical protein
MFRRFLITAGAAAALLTGSLTGPATAASCLYVAINPFTQKVSDDIRGRSVGTQKGACRRAKRYCLNKLKRAWKKGKAQQFACKRVD